MSRTPSAAELARLARLELEAREVVEGFLSGPHRSPYFGQSLEFAQHREYVAGDDTRRLDWKVYSKTDKLYLKLYEEETNLRTLLLVDASESMRFGIGEANRGQSRSKFDQACLLAASIAYLLLRQQDSVGLTTFDSAVRSQVMPRTSQRHLRTLLDALATESPQQKTGIYDVLRSAADQRTQRGLIVLLSDLLVPTDEFARGLALLRQRRHEVVVLQVLDPQELSFEFSGTTRFVGLEETGEVTCEPRTLREGYLAALERHQDEVRRACSRSGCDYRLVRTDESPSATLASMLASRKQIRR